LLALCGLAITHDELQVQLVRVATLDFDFSWCGCVCDCSRNGWMHKQLSFFAPGWLTSTNALTEEQKAVGEEPCAPRFRLVFGVTTKIHDRLSRLFVKSYY
jgi:hypothetical protein